MDLAYKNKNYNEILEMDKQIRGTISAKQTNFSKYIDVLVIGACYKLVNIPNILLELWLNFNPLNLNPVEYAGVV